MKAVQMGTEDAGQVAHPGRVPLLVDQKERQEANVLETLVHLSTMLPTGWRAEVRPGSVVLYWQAA